MTQSNYFISVISTVFNGEAYLDRAIPSILSQLDVNFEYIIVDDGSVDQTLSALRIIEREDPRVRVFSPGRLGRARALNYAVQNSNGEYIANQDFDDISHPNRLRLQADFLSSHPNVGVVGGAYIRVDNERREKYVRSPACSHLALVQTMAKCVPFAHTISMFRRQAWEDVGGYPEANNLIDLRFWLNIIEARWEIASIPEVVGEHWVHANSYWHRNFKYLERQKDLARVQRQVIRKLHLPSWYIAYPTGRYMYAYLPHGFKSFIRRSMLRIQEENIS